MIEEKHAGDWHIKDDKLYKGDTWIIDGPKLADQACITFEEISSAIEVVT